MVANNEVTVSGTSNNPTTAVLPGWIVVKSQHVNNASKSAVTVTYFL